MSITIANTAAALMSKGKPPLPPSGEGPDKNNEEDELRQQQRKPQPESLYQINRALIRMLMILSEAGDAGLYTRELLDRMGSVDYAQKMIRLGEEKGYIRRVRNIKPEGKGNYKVMNHITSKGKLIVRRWTQAADANNNKA